jgi:hypothetical protein
MKLPFFYNRTTPFLGSKDAKKVFLFLPFLIFSIAAFGEGSGNWGTETNRQSMLWYPGNAGTGGFANRGYMLLPSTVSGYNAGHRLNVYAKAGETVFWGFRRVGSTGNIMVRWFYDASAKGEAQRRPENAVGTLNGPVPEDSPQSLMVNTTVVMGPDHIWWATGDNGFSNPITINTWAGSYNTEIQGSFRVLPGQWLFFSGKSLENGVKVEWGTVQKKDNEKFILQRSKDGKSWSEISVTKGEGNSERPVLYLDWDMSPMVEPNFYRLNQQDLSGKYDYKSVIKVDIIPDGNIQLYPNPAFDRLLIKTKQIGNFEVVLIDTNGGKIPLKAKNLHGGKSSYDLKNVRAGIYLIYLIKANS